MEGDKPLRTPISSPIESRSVPPSSSKADRVQGESEGLFEIKSNDLISITNVFSFPNLNFYTLVDEDFKCWFYVPSEL